MRRDLSGTKKSGDRPFIVITSKYEVLKVGYETVRGMRKVWSCSDLDVFVVGALSGKLFEQAANLAMQECVARHIRPSSLRLVAEKRHINPIETETRRMF